MIFIIIISSSSSNTKKDSRIVMMDEPTASVDMQTDRQVQCQKWKRKTQMTNSYDKVKKHISVNNIKHTTNTTNKSTKRMRHGYLQLASYYFIHVIQMMMDEPTASVTARPQNRYRYILYIITK